LRNSFKIAIAAIVAVAALGGILALVLRHDGSTTGHLSFASPEPAPAPFAAFKEARVAYGNKCLRLLIAETEAQRVQGLREVTNLAPYDGMLFVFPNDNIAQFTMAQTPMPLDITFFDEDGTPLDFQPMKPCPDGTDATCPPYSSDHKYRLALETPSGSQHPGGSLGPCAA
jgi:uncharacterized membrane protein (UPF0127 family)